MAIEQDAYSYIYSNVGFEYIQFRDTYAAIYSNVGPNLVDSRNIYSYIYSNVGILEASLTIGFNKGCYIYGSAPGGIVDALGLF